MPPSWRLSFSPMSSAYNTLFCLLLSTPLLAIPAKNTVEKAVSRHGGKDSFYRLRDVELQLNTEAKNSTITSTERYIFDGEKSIGISESGKVDSSGNYQRREHYFFFTLPFKFLDRGIQYETL